MLRSFLRLLFLRLKTPGSPSLSSCIICSSPLNILVAHRLSCSNMSASHWGAQNWAWYSRCCFRSAEHRGRITSLPFTLANIAQYAASLPPCNSALMTSVRLVHHNSQLLFHSKTASYPDSTLPVVTGGCITLHGWLHTDLCWTSWGSCQPISPTCQGSSDQQTPFWPADLHFDHPPSVHCLQTHC